MIIIDILMFASVAFCIIVGTILYIVESKPEDPEPTTLRGRDGMGARTKRTPWEIRRDAPGEIGLNSDTDDIVDEWMRRNGP